jgi:hypothetical protein
MRIVPSLRTSVVVTIVLVAIASFALFQRGFSGIARATDKASVPTATFGIQWRELPGNPLITPGACFSWRCAGVGDPTLLVDSRGTLSVWFTTMGIHREKEAFVTTGPVIGKATGGTPFSPKLRVVPEAPVIAVGADDAWDRYVETPTVRIVGNTLTMWYLGYSKPGFQAPAIGQMTATDATGTAWTRPDRPIYRATAGAWDSTLVTGPTVLQGPDGVWRLYYAGYGMSNGKMRNGIGLLTSRNGVDWIADPNNPLLESQPGAWDDEILEQAVVYANGQYYLWYSGWRGELKPDTVISIGLATSSDGTHWTRYARNPVITPGASGSWNDMGVLAPDVLVQSDGSLLMAAYGRSKKDIGKQAGFIGFWSSR